MRPRKTILCVEGNEQVLSVRKFLLETRGYRVLAMNCAAEALEYLNDAAPGAVDLLLSARKRGPKKQVQSVSVVEERELAVAS